jgi:hypothetical protein
VISQLIKGVDMLRVVVVFEFEGITDPDSAMSDVITESITQDCEEMRGSYGATACWVDDVYVQEGVTK